MLMQVEVEAVIISGHPDLAQATMIQVTSEDMSVCRATGLWATVSDGASSLSTEVLWFDHGGFLHVLYNCHSDYIGQRTSSPKLPLRWEIFACHVCLLE